MREGKARVIIGDTLSKCEALRRIEMLSFYTFKDFFITPNSLHLCIYVAVCQVIVFFFFNLSFHLPPIQVSGMGRGLSKHLFLLPSLSMHYARHKDITEQPDIVSVSTELRVEPGEVD